MAVDLDQLMAQHSTSARSKPKPKRAPAVGRQLSLLDLLMDQHSGQEPPRRQRRQQHRPATQGLPLFARIQDLPAKKMTVPTRSLTHRERAVLGRVKKAKVTLSSRELARRAKPLHERRLELVERMDDQGEDRAALMVEIIEVSHEHADLAMTHEIVTRRGMELADWRRLYDSFRHLAGGADRLGGMLAEDWRGANYRFDLADAWGMDWRAFFTIHSSLSRYLPSTDRLERELAWERHLDADAKRRGVKPLMSWLKQQTLAERLDRIRHSHAAILFRPGMRERNADLFSGHVTYTGGTGYFGTWYEHKKNDYRVSYSVGGGSDDLIKLTGKRLERFVNEWVENEYVHHSGFESELARLRLVAGVPLAGD